MRDLKGPLAVGLASHNPGPNLTLKLTTAAINGLGWGAWLLDRLRAKIRTSAFMALAPKAA